VTKSLSRPDPSAVYNMSTISSDARRRRNSLEGSDREKDEILFPETLLRSCKRSCLVILLLLLLLLYQYTAYKSRCSRGGFLARVYIYYTNNTATAHMTRPINL